MATLNFHDYLERFEVMIHDAVLAGQLGKMELVSVRPPRLESAYFGRVMYSSMDFDEPFAINYYGLIKRSRGFLDQLNEACYELRGKQLKMMETTVVHFASVKMEDLNYLTANEQTIGHFPQFKAMVLGHRNFRETRIKSNPKLCTPGQ